MSTDIAPTTAPVQPATEGFFALLMSAVAGALAMGLYLGTEMSLVGAVLNAVAYGLAFMALGTRSPWWGLMFGMSSLLLGPFMLPVQALLGSASAEFARLDYLLALLYGLQSFAKSSPRWNTPWLIWWLALGVSLLLSVSHPNGTGLPLESASDYYGIVGRCALAAMLAHCFLRALTQRTTPPSGLTWGALALVVAHLALSLLQFKYDIGLRTGTAEAGLSVMGVQINRPTGLLEVSYVYGAVSVFVLILARAFFWRHGALQSQWTSVWGLTLVVACISTRSLLLAMVLYGLCWVFMRWVQPSWRWAWGLALSGLALWLVVSNYWALVALDESNGTKLAMWALVLNELITNSTPVQWLFGHGINSASEVTAGLGDFVSRLGISAGLDTRATAGEGFPIHNVYLQALYEFGAVFFLALAWLTWRFVSVAWRQGPIWGFVALVMVTNYLLHNGFMAVPLVGAMLIIEGLDRRAAHS